MKGAVFDMFDLEKLEKKIVIFLLGTLLLGVAVIAYKRSFPAGSLCIKSHSAPLMPAGSDIPEKNKKININRASAGELTSLKGVGPVLAERIVEYRLKKVRFVSTEELKKVPGIGDKIFLKIKDDISLE